MLAVGSQWCLAKWFAGDSNAVADLEGVAESAVSQLAQCVETSGPTDGSCLLKGPLGGIVGS